MVYHKSEYDVLILGAGVIGGMAARELSRYRLRVCLVEREHDVATGASRANSGIIHGGYDPVPGTLKAEMNAQGIGLLYQAARELNVHHQQNGSFVCAFGPEEEPAIDALYRRAQENGIEGISILTGDEARTLEPELSPAVTRVLNVPNAGIICPYDLTIAAVGNAMDNGVSLVRSFDTVSIKNEEDGFLLTAADGRELRGRYLVNCAGARSDRVAALAGDGFFTIIPRAGEYLLLDKNEGSRVRRTIFQVPGKEGKGILVTPTADGNLLTGPTAVRVDAPEDTETTPDGLAAVQRLAARSVPGVDFRQVITSFSGVRASEAHDDFIIRRSEAIPGLIHAAAIDSPGLTSCVAIARRIAALLQEAGLTLEEKTDWDGTRENTRAFRELSEEEQDAYIREHPAYGRIVCRCETVSEGEILAAIRRNPPAYDVDGVKRRTRSGMGRCQGGFCLPHVIRLLSEVHGIPMEEVTKSGPGSEPLVGRL